MKTISTEYILSVVIMLFGQSSPLIQALIINYLVKYLKESDAPGYEGGLMTVAFILVSIFGCCFRNNAAFRTLLLTGRIKNMIAILISEKVLTLNNGLVSEESTRGKIFNIISTDMELLELTVFTFFPWIVPFIIIFAIIIIVFTFGLAGLVGIGIAILHLPFVW